MIHPPELTNDEKQLRFTSVPGSAYYYPRATKRCRTCGFWYAPFAVLWSVAEPDVCSICATPIVVKRAK